MGKIRKLWKYALKGINFTIIASFLLITIHPTLKVNAATIYSETKHINQSSMNKLKNKSFESSFLSIPEINNTRRKNVISSSITQSPTPIFYTGLEALPEVNLVKPQGQATWIYGNTTGITLDQTVGLVFKSSMSPTSTGLEFVGKRMHCSTAGCDGGISMWNDTSDQLGYWGIESDFCVAAGYGGLSASQICNLIAPTSHLLSLGVTGFPREAGSLLAGGFAVGWDKSQEARLHVYDIHFLYYGTPPSIRDSRSSLSNNTPKNGTSDPRECAVSACGDSGAAAGDPINTLNGNFDYSTVDLSLQTVAGPLTLQRSYASLATDTNLYPTDLSPGWSHNHDSRLIFESGSVWFKAHTLNQYQFIDEGNHVYSPYPGVLAELIFDDQGTPLDPNDDIYTITASDQSLYVFDHEGRLVSWKNELGFGFDYTYSYGQLYRVTEALSGRFLQFNYTNNRLTSVQDNAGRQVFYGYDGNNDLTSFTDVRSKTWGYSYSNHQLETLTSPDAAPNTILETVYDDQMRAYEQFDGLGNRIVQITYNGDGTRTLTDALGRTSRQGFDGRNTNTMLESTSGYQTYKTYDNNFRPLKTEDQDGHITQMSWSADGANMTAITDAGGFSTSMQYDSQNHLTQINDPYNTKTIFNYNGSLLQDVTRRDAADVTLSVTAFTYTTAADTPQPSGLLKTLTDARGNVSEYAYDSAGQLDTITQIVPGGQNVVTHMDYDALGRLSDLTGPTGMVTHYTYDPAGNLLTITENYDLNKSTNQDTIWNRTTTYTYGDLGQLDFVTNPMGIVESDLDYDKAGQIILVTDAADQSTAYTYSDAAELETITMPNGYKLHYVYNQTSGTLQEVYEVNAASQENLLQSFSYYPNGNLASETKQQPDQDYIVEYAYDAMQRVNHSWDNNNHDLTYSYNAYGNLLNRSDTIANVTTRYEYNALGFLESVTENFIEGVNPDYETNVRTQYETNALGLLESVINARGYETVYTYNPLNQLWTVSDPLQHITTYQYDLLGNPETVEDANGNLIDYDYDEAGRLSSIDYPGGSLNDPETTFIYDALSRTTDMYDSLGHTEWHYDDLNQISSVVDPYGQSLGYSYNAIGQRETLTYPGGRTITTNYDWRALPYQVLDNQTLLAEYTFDTAQRLDTIARGNGVTSQYTYYPDGELETLTHSNWQGPLAGYAYEYDSAGNRTWASETFYDYDLVYLPLLLKQDGGLESLAAPGAFENPGTLAESTLNAYPAPLESTLPQALPSIETPSIDGAYPAPLPGSGETSFLQEVWDFLVDLFAVNPATVAAYSGANSAYPAPPIGEDPMPVEGVEIDYSYDPLNRLTSAVYNNGLNFSYAYDAAGNRTSQTIDSVTTISQYDAADRLTNLGGVSFSWDDNGNLLNDGLYTYSYDYANRLTGLSSPSDSYSFRYDGLGNRYRQTVNGITTPYILDIAAGLTQVLADGSSTYFGGLGFENSSGLFYSLPDALGSTRQLTNSGGLVAFTQSFDPYGNVLQQSAASLTPFGYSGEQSDPSGLIYLRARFHSPTQGRFITRDPVPGYGQHPGHAQSVCVCPEQPCFIYRPKWRKPAVAVSGCSRRFVRRNNIRLRISGN